MKYKFLLLMLCYILKIQAQNTYVVTSTGDSNPFTLIPGELRWALRQAELHPGVDNITFNIPGPPPHTIQLHSDLPPLFQGIVMDGNTQPGTLTNGDKKIHIIGSNTLQFILLIWPLAGANQSTIRNLTLANAPIIALFVAPNGGHIFNDNIVYNNNTVITAPFSLIEFQCPNTTIKGNIIGTDHTFSTNSIFYSNSGCAINTNFCGGNTTIGGLLPGEKNYFYNVRAPSAAGAFASSTNTKNKISGNIFINNAGNENIQLHNSGTLCPANYAKDIPSYYYNITGGILTMQGTSLPNDFIEIYKSDPLWNDAISLLGTTTADASGHFTSIISGVAANEKVIITATDPQNYTSDFSWPCASEGFLQVSGAQCPGNTTTISYSATPTLTNFPGTTNPLNIQVIDSLYYGPSLLAFGATINTGQYYSTSQTNLPVGSYFVTFTFKQATPIGEPYFGIGCPNIRITEPLVIRDCAPPCSDCIGSFNPKPGDTLIVSTWVKEENAQATKVNYNLPKLSVEYPGSSAAASGPFFAKGQIIDNWQRLEEQFIVPTTAVNLRIKLECISGNCLYDDIRVFPKNGSMKSYVYDPKTMRLVAELDERNYATIYEYDEEGKLTRIKKETERGIMTIQENKSSSSKK